MITNQTIGIGTMSHGNRERAQAIRTYKRLRAQAAHKLALAEHTRTGIDTAMRLRDEADALYTAAREIATDWQLRS